MLPIIIVPPVAIAVLLVMFYSDRFRTRNFKTAKPYDYANQPDDLPKWNAMNPIAKKANKELKRMYRGNQLM